MVAYTIGMTSRPHATLRLFRQIHLYIGIFISPALLFFAFTGALQTFSLHEQVKGSDYRPPAWVAKMAQLHKNQTTEMSHKPGQGDHGGAGGHGDSVDKGAAAAKGQPAPAAPMLTKRQQHVPMKIFFVLVALGLFTSTLTGLYMAYRYSRKAWVVTAWLVAGLVVPLVLMAF